jgi:hypothetical protein
MRGRSGNFRAIHSPASRTCDWGHEITRIRVIGTSGTTARPRLFVSGLIQHLSSTVFLLEEVSYVGYVESSTTLPRPGGGVSPPCNDWPLNPRFETAICGWQKHYSAWLRARNGVNERTRVAISSSFDRSDLTDALLTRCIPLGQAPGDASPQGPRRGPGVRRFAGIVEQGQPHRRVPRQFAGWSS